MIPVSELVGAELDYWAARADGIPADHLEIRPVQRPDPGTPKTICVHKLPHRDLIIGPDEVRMQPSTCWAQGGLLIEKHAISLAPDCHEDLKDPVPGIWYAQSWPDAHNDVLHEGNTPLIAAMRALVTLYYGKYVPVGYDYEVPK